jgi:uncharacterized protein
MPRYAAPGIYVEEVPSGARPIGAVGTSTAGFVGVAPDQSARRGEAVAVNNWTDFVRIFAGPENAPSTPLARAVYGFFANGGGRCHIVNIAEGEPIAGGGRRRSGLQLLEAVDEVAIVAAPGYADPLSYEALLGECERLGDRLAILDPPLEVPDISQLTRVGTAGSSSTGSATGGRNRKPADGKGSDNGDGDDADPGAGAPGAGGLRPRESSYGALYFPSLDAYDPLTGKTVPTPPSGHVAGVWARTDSRRGVHKAPANEPLLGGVTGLTYLVTRQEQEVLNPKGVNCIRTVPSGIRIWGARTLAAEASEWRYLNVRRLMNMLKGSIEQGTQWIVFEPNEYSLWATIRLEISAFLTRVWRDGALLGRTPQEAFFVKCDEETNPPEVRDAGQVVTLIGVAPVKPAEFVVFKLSQSMAGAETETVGS